MKKNEIKNQHISSQKLEFLMDRLRRSRSVALMSIIAFFSSFSLHTLALSNQRTEKLNERMALMAEIYELSVRHYKQHEDANRFLWAVEHLLPSDVVAATNVVLAYNKQVLPTVDFFDETSAYRINSADGKEIALKAINTTEGFYEIQGQEFHWKKDLGFQENLMRLQTHVSSYSSFSEDEAELYALTTQMLQGLLPEAHAGGYHQPSGNKKHNWPKKSGHGAHGQQQPGQAEPVPPGAGKGVVEEKPKDSVSEQQDKAKKRCERENVKNQKRCKTMGLIGIILGVVVAAILIAKLTGDDDDKKPTPSRPDPKPLKPWVDARDGLTSAVSNPGGSTPPAPPAGYELVS